jgi:hypothetical protein
MGRFGVRCIVVLSALTACAHTPPAAKPTVAKAATADAGGLPSRSAPHFGPEAIDAALRAEWKRAGVVPASRADDATFLRRATIDLVGTVPAPETTARFLADPSADKRAKAIDALLGSPEYVEHWTSYWDDVLMGSTTKGNLVDPASFRQWLRGRFAANAPWDAIVRDLVSATGQNGNGGPRAAAKGDGKAAAMQPSMGAEPEGERDDVDPAAINGAVNWTLKFEQSPQDLGGSASRVFLGVQIQCAQCHDHKTESWTQDDFRRFSSGFLHSKLESLEGRQKGVIKRVALLDAAASPPRFAKNAELAPLVRAKATALDGTDVEKGKDTRKALAAWMTSKQNKWFAKAFVNRMWGHLLGRGFYDPVDDIRPSNPSTAPELLDRIAADFTAHDFDIRYLLREICATEAYQLAAVSDGSKADPENKLWGRFHLVPLGPEELLNALLRVTDLEQTTRKAGIADFEALRANIVRQYAFLFDTDEETDEPDYSGTVSQALALLNGPLVAQGARALPGSAASAIANGQGTDAQKVDALAMRVLARHPTAEESTRWAEYIADATHRDADDPRPKRGAKPGPPPGANKPALLARLRNRRANVSHREAAFEDLFWMLLNSSEFTFNH